MTNQMIYRSLLGSILLLLFIFTGYGQSPNYDLLIQNVRAFDSRTKQVHKHKSILINADTIVAVINSSPPVNARKRIQGRSRLVVPGIFFFDHIYANPQYDAELKALFDKMARHKVSLSTTIHVMGAVAGKTYFFSSLSLEDTLNLAGYSLAQKQRLGQAFGVMMHYLKVAHEKGGGIRIGTDCRYGGKALLSELLLLHEAHFSTADILQITTLNGASAMHLDDRYGVIEAGKQADLVLFDKDPFTDYRHFLAKKTLIKGGMVVEI